MPHLIGLFLAAVLAAAAGVYAWAQLPIALLAAILFFLTGAAPLRDRSHRAVDAWLLAALAVVALQLVPLPATVIAGISPAAIPLQDAISLAPLGEWRPLTIRPAATRQALLAAIAGALTFWAARHALRDGGSRSLVGVVGVTGIALALLTHAQRATAPETLLWLWRPYAEGARPYGPFVDRNHLATWIVLAVPAIAGLATARTIAAGLDHLPWRVRAARIFSAPGVTLPLVSVALLGLTLVATLSRSGLVAGAAAVVLASALRRGHPLQRAAAAAVGVSVLAAAALWLNSAGIGERLAATLSQGGETSRMVIWSESLRLAAAFPVVGTGAGTFADAMLQYQQRGTTVLFNHAHNEALQLLAEGGGVLLAIALGAGAAFGLAARRALRASSGAERALRAGAILGLAAGAMQSIWDTGLHTPANLLLAAVLAALAIYERGHRPHDSQSTTV
ncbi:MAG: O-antigen ligase family protein [Vicinamibacterales bacterium]